LTEKGPTKAAHTRALVLKPSLEPLEQLCQREDRCVPRAAAAPRPGGEAIGVLCHFSHSGGNISLSSAGATDQTEGSLTVVGGKPLFIISPHYG